MENTTVSYFRLHKKHSIVAVSLGLVVLTALADRAIGTRASLGLLYMLPMIVAALVLSRIQVVGLAVVCALLRARFDLPAPQLETLLRFLFALIAYAGSGLFVIALIRNRAATEEHLATIRREQGLRHEAEEQLKILVESSPAAIMTLDSAGTVCAANNAAERLLITSEDQSLKGKSIGHFLPVLSDALQFNADAAGLRTAAQSQGFRDNGEIFLANLWFSTWKDAEGTHLAAIVVDASEEMRDREEEALQQSLRANRIAAAAVSHEVRNLCSAISVVSGNLAAAHAGDRNEDVQALHSLVMGLEKIASVELHDRAGEMLEELEPQVLLDDLRIVIEPQWREIGGVIRWELPASMPHVPGERHGLLQVFLNLAQNSHRAVQDAPVKQLTISATADEERVILRFEDSGPGIASPERLFAPFQSGADGTGLGLYVSRAVVRGYGGDLRWEPCVSGTSFAVELPVAI
jgi:two-component system sensor kinase FixL